MARTPARLPNGARISDFVTLGVLTTTVPAELIDGVLQETGRQSQRYRLLPAPLVVYYVMALALYAQASYGEVLRCLLEGVRWLRLRGIDVAAASKSDHSSTDPPRSGADEGIVPACGAIAGGRATRRARGTGGGVW